MTKIERTLRQMKNAPASVKFSDLASVCEYFFGEPRQNGTSHKVYKTPWPGDPRVNIQKKKGMAKPYQVRQVLKAISRLQGGA